jgi:hypothetical protein
MGAIMAEETLGGLKNLPTNMKCTASLIWQSLSKACSEAKESAFW